MSRLASAVARSPSQSIIGLPSKLAGYRVYTAADGAANHTRAGSTSFYRLSGRLIVSSPFIVTAVSWDIRNASTYTCEFITTGAGSTNLFTVMASGDPGTGDNTVITPDGGDFLLLPGIYFLSLYTAVAKTWWDMALGYSDSAGVVSTGYVWYDTTGYNYALPVRLSGWYLPSTGLSNFSKY